MILIFLIFSNNLLGQEIIKVSSDTVITVSSDTIRDKIIYVKGNLDYVLYDLNAQNISYVVYELPSEITVNSIADITRYPVVKLWMYRDFPMDSVLMNIVNISKETGKCFCDHCRLSAADEILAMKKGKAYAIYIKGKSYKLVFKAYPPPVTGKSNSHKFDSLMNDTLDPLDLIIFKTPGDDFHLHVYENVMHNDWDDTVLCYINFFIRRTAEFHKPLIPTRSAPKNTYMREKRTDVYSDEIIAYLKSNPKAKLEVIVYCDADTKHKNPPHSSSLDRNHTVKYYDLLKLFFARNGIGEGRLKATYMGSSNPLYPNPVDQKQHQANNRIRLVMRK